MNPQERQQIAQALADWFHANGRDYPWRRTTDPWAVLVSEVMLQQTTIPTVLGRYADWMRRFPTPQALAAATEDEALRSWEGLGYYRRVRSLRAASQAIVERHGGVFPTEAVDIRALPGIGDYTAGAVLSFAFNKPAPLVDANVARVFARLCNSRTPVDSPAGRREQWCLAEQMLHRTDPRAYNSALMELGQLVCTAGAPQCLLCPVRAWCRAKDKNPAELPVKLPKKQTTALEHWDILHVTKRGILLELQPEGKRHAGLWRLPRRSQEEVQGLEHIADQAYSVTRYRVTRHLHRAAPGTRPRKGESYIPLHGLEQIPMASPDRKIINALIPGSHAR